MRIFNFNRWFLWLFLYLLTLSLPLRAFHECSYDLYGPSCIVEASIETHDGSEALQQKRYEEAYKDFETAHKRGDDLGAALMVTLLMNGWGVKADPFKAKLLFEKKYGINIPSFLSVLISMLEMSMEHHW
ncbi:hypothetical protein [Helicobacter ailurogastricus]|uniref:Uncharacterized protein n=1 Tax=Helicobacter ailurogastricus TaxID=1578720 RepID=A0A0K2XB93_9HELI|nr:hypothetical protein [Helicobacter ailurogastricus]CRF40972.1 hypothetical protein HAL011_07480 [Helicobacter ailurogastricus]CRF42353.1 hypothetical protein HAL013_05230 [Helicobacter ailurogastricus]CRF44630.1 hypothetical protein HAL09_12240 [Helicobacter ailurogastricus]